jgi:N-acetylglutamate synthase-like GNAT family acetyltransferase
MKITNAKEEDLKRILKLQKICYKQEAEIYNDYSIPPLKQTYKEIIEECNDKTVLKAVIDNKIIGSVRAYEEKGTCYIGRLIVHPKYQNKGFGSKLLHEIESKFKNTKKYELFTGHKSKKNIYLYEKSGYKIFKKEKINDSLSLVYLEKYKKKDL